MGPILWVDHNLHLESPRGHQCPCLNTAAEGSGLPAVALRLECVSHLLRELVHMWSLGLLLHNWLPPNLAA